MITIKIVLNDSTHEIFQLKDDNVKIEEISRIDIFMNKNVKSFYEFLSIKKAIEENEE